MQKWEYNLLVQSPNTECARCEEALNGLGRDGWELVTFYVNGGERSGFTDAPDRTNFTYSFDHLTDRSGANTLIAIGQGGHEFSGTCARKSESRRAIKALKRQAVRLLGKKHLDRRRRRFDNT